MNPRIQSDNLRMIERIQPKKKTIQCGELKTRVTEDRLLHFVYITLKGGGCECEAHTPYTSFLFFCVYCRYFFPVYLFVSFWHEIIIMKLSCRIWISVST